VLLEEEEKKKNLLCKIHCNITNRQLFLSISSTVDIIVRIIGQIN
jgi:hypothetical protein